MWCGIRLGTPYRTVDVLGGGDVWCLTNLRLVTCLIMCLYLFAYVWVVTGRDTVVAVSRHAGMVPWECARL